MQCKKEQFTNKGRDTLLNGYMEDKLKNIYRKLWAKGAATSLLVECHFYTLVNILLSYYMFIYNSDKQSTKILDLFTFKFKGKGPIRCMLLIFIIYIGKQN